MYKSWTIRPSDRPKTRADLLVDFEWEITEGFAGRYIRFKVCQLVGKAGITSSDLPDLQQDLALVLFLRLPKFDHQRGHWNAFVVTVVERQIATMLKTRRARKRQNGMVVSLNAVGHSLDGSATELAERIKQRCDSQSNENVTEADFKRIDLRNDVSAIVAGLSAESRSLCHHLQHGSVADAALRLHLSRATLYRRVRLLRMAFGRAGFGSRSKKSETCEVQMQ